MQDVSDNRYTVGDADRSALAALADKYDRMHALRERLGRGAPSADDRVVLKQLAHDFPGSLRELETLRTNEIDERRRAAHAGLGASTVPAWLMWTAAYHAAMRDALDLRRDRNARTALPHGRLNVKVFAALAVRFDVPAVVLWDRLFPRRGAAHRPYR